MKLRHFTPVDRIIFCKQENNIIKVVFDGGHVERHHFPDIQGADKFYNSLMEGLDYMRKCYVFR